MNFLLLVLVLVLVVYIRQKERRSPRVILDDDIFNHDEDGL